MAALGLGDPDVASRYQLVLDRIVALGAGIGRLKYALALRSLGGTTARMTVDPPDAALSAAIAAEVAALLSVSCRAVSSWRRTAVNRGPGQRVIYSEVRRKRGAGPQIGSVIVRVPGSRPGESGAPGSWPVRAGRRV